MLQSWRVVCTATSLEIVSPTLVYASMQSLTSRCVACRGCHNRLGRPTDDYHHFYAEPDPPAIHATIETLEASVKDGGFRRWH